MFLMYHSPIRCIRSETLRMSCPAFTVITLSIPTLLLLKKFPQNNRNEAKNHAYKDHSTYRQGTSAFACLLPGHHLPGHGVRNVSLLLPNHDNVALVWNELLTLHFRTDTAPARSPWTQRPKQL